MLNVHLIKMLPHFTISVDFTVETEIVALIGPSGAGKTTILECIVGFQRPDAGEITLDGIHLFHSQQEINVPSRSRHVGFVPQDQALFPHMDVKSNILYGAKTKPSKLNQDGGGRLKTQRPVVTPTLAHPWASQYQTLLETLGIAHLESRYPVELSGGEKQRVALARAWMTRPKLLLMDEPFSALDREKRLSLQDGLREWQKQWNIPILLVTHDQEEVDRLANRQIRIDRGKIVT
jgi:molybdate transport system ATP-binding protein